MFIEQDQILIIYKISEWSNICGSSMLHFKRYGKSMDLRKYDDVLWYALKSEPVQ